MRLRDKVILISGAGFGMGRETAKIFAGVVQSIVSITRNVGLNHYLNNIKRLLSKNCKFRLSFLRDLILSLK